MLNKIIYIKYVHVHIYKSAGLELFIIYNKGIRAWSYVYLYTQVFFYFPFTTLIASKKPLFSKPKILFGAAQDEDSYSGKVKFMDDSNQHMKKKARTKR